MTVDRTDILINRVVDGSASAEDWAELESLASADPGVWRGLGEAQRQHAALSAGVADALAIADGVEAPVEYAGGADRYSARWRVWGGWAAAAALALAWGASRGLLPSQQAPGGQTAGLTPAGWSSERAFDEYMARGLEEGRVLAELPTVMVDAARPADDPDATDITIMRRVIERRRVRGAYSVGVDELGQLRLVPADPIALDASSSAPQGGRP